MSPQFSKEKYQEIIDNYSSGMTQQQVAEKHGTSRGTILNILRRFYVEIRNYTGERKSNRRWYWDFDFFSRRNSRVAYWAGFMMADGGLVEMGKNTYGLFVMVHWSDEDHIKMFCSDIGLDDAAIYHYGPSGRMGDNQVGLHIHHYNLAEHLRPWGIVLRKSYVFVEPQVSDELLPHYLRGWADGDGQIYISGTGARFTVSGNRQALEWYALALMRLGYQGGYGFQDRGNDVAILYIGGVNQVSEIMRLLQVEGNLKLERKWNKIYNTNFTMVVHICERCGKEFKVKEHRHKYETKFGRFCSRVCQNEWQKTRKRS